MKKSLAFILTILIGLSALAACISQISSHATDESDNDVDFDELSEAASDKVTGATSSAVKPSTTLNETADTASSKGSKPKITTDKDGWVNKWY